MSFFYYKSIILNFFIKYSKITSAFFIFILVSLFAIWSHPSLIPKISPDGYGYWSIAKDFFTSISDASIRPWFFPLFLRVCMTISPDQWQVVLSLFQIFFHSITCVLIYFVFRKYSLKYFSALVCTLIIGFNPNLISYTTYILADSIFAVLTTFAWYYFLKINESSNWNFKSIVLASIFCALSLLTKPVALFLIFPFLFGIYLLKGFSYNFIKIAIFMIFINFSMIILQWV